MPNLPLEILRQVFDHLSRQCRLQCMLVCKTWYPAALSGLDSYIILRNRIDAKRMLRQLLGPYPTLQGNSVRRLSFMTSSEDYVDTKEFIQILSICSHLEVLELMDSDQNQTNVAHLHRARNCLQLQAIKAIRVPYLLSKSHEYASAVYVHGQKLTELNLYIDLECLSDIPSSNKMYTFLSKFSALKQLTLHFSCEVALHDILEACPQLERLHLVGDYATGTLPKHDFMLYSPNSSSNSSVEIKLPQFKLRFLCINATFLTQDLIDYLSKNTKKLYELSILDGEFVSNPRFGFHSMLPIMSIKLQNFTCKNSTIIQGLGWWFPQLARIELEGCFLHSAADDNMNILIDLYRLNLDYLSLDLGVVIRYADRKSSTIHKIDLEVIQSTRGQAFYQHKVREFDGLFHKKESYLYARNFSKGKRIRSVQSAVVTIKVKSLNYIRLHYNTRNKLNHMVNLNA